MQFELMAANIAIRHWLEKTSPRDRHLDKSGGILSALCLVRRSNPSMYAIYRPQLSSEEIEIVECSPECSRRRLLSSSPAATRCPVCSKEFSGQGCDHLLAILDRATETFVSGSAKTLLVDWVASREGTNEEKFNWISKACIETADYSIAVSVNGEDVYYNTGERWYWSKNPIAARTRMIDEIQKQKEGFSQRRLREFNESRALRNAEYPSKQTDATEFIVHDGGTLEMEGIELPKTRAEAYDLSLSNPVEAGDLLGAAEDCQPLNWELCSAYSSHRENLENELAALNTTNLEGKNLKKIQELEASLSELPSDPDSGMPDWVESLSKKNLKPLVRQIRSWLKAPPDWAQEDDYIPQEKTGQGAALEFFQNMENEEIESLGITIVEGDRPGSSYYAAVLGGDIKTANLAAVKNGINVWFKSA